MTTDQLALDLPAMQSPASDRDLPIQERYEQWRDLNQWVIPALAQLLNDWSAHGGRRVGVKSAVEWLRWHHARATAGNSFKFDNTFSSRLARDVIDRYPHLEPVIETRVLRAA